MSHIAAAFAELGFQQSEAEHRARLTYSAYLGFLQLQQQQLKKPHKLQHNPVLLILLVQLMEEQCMMKMQIKLALQSKLELTLLSQWS